MIDRFGKEIRVAWADHEIIWIKAALKLDRWDRPAAYQDIAAMSGRTEFQVKRKAREVREQMKKDAEILASLRAYPRRTLVPGPAPKGRNQIAWAPSKAQLMGAR